MNQENARAQAAQLIKEWEEIYKPPGSVSFNARAALIDRIAALPSTPSDEVAQRARAIMQKQLAEHEHVSLVDGIFGGVTPVVSKIRISAHDIVTYFHNGRSLAEICETYSLTPDAVLDALAFVQDVYDDVVDLALRTTTDVEQGTCTWACEPAPDIEMWETNCGNAFQFEAGGPTENKMQFCCYCGKLLAEATKENSNE